MFGLNPNEILPTREVETYLNAIINNVSKGEEIWIITPYATMKKLGTIKRGLVEAAKRKANISFVIRDEIEQVTPLKQDLAEAVKYGIKLFALKRLHAKVYWVENQGCILTSANLVDGSFESSTEIGIFIPGGHIYNEIRDWIAHEIETKVRPIGGKDIAKSSKTMLKKNNVDFHKSKSSQSNFNSSFKIKMGFCIRCGEKIKFNPDKPYCLDDYKSWSFFSNDHFEEKLCHNCGKPYKSTMEKPVCYSCYKKIW